MANDKTPFAGLNILNAGSYYNWPDRNADNTIVDENLKDLTDFENLKTRHNYDITETVANGLYTCTTLITDAGGEEIARRVVQEEIGTGEYVSYLTTETIQGVTRQWRVAETATGYVRNGVI